MHALIGPWIGLLAAAWAATDAELQPRPGWNRTQVDLRASASQQIKAVLHPPARRPRMSARQTARVPQSPRRTVIRPPAAALSVGAEAGRPVLAGVIDSPPLDGFVPWIAVSTTSAKRGYLELDAVPSAGVVGSFTTSDPALNYAIGLLDTGAGTSIMSNAGALALGLLPAYNTGLTTTLEGATGSVDAWVSRPLGLFVNGLAAIDPDTLVLDTSALPGQWNVSILMGQTPVPPAPDLPTAIGAPLAVYFATEVDNRLTRSITRGGTTYTGPDVRLADLDDPCVPQYPYTIPLELRPLGGASVQYVPCIDIFGSCAPARDGDPQSPSIIVGNSAQSLFFVGSVFLSDAGRQANDKDRFMLDTGAQVTVIGSRIAALLGLKPSQAEFQVEIQGVNGQTIIRPGFYLDTIDLPALEEWLSFTDVPVVFLDVASPEGGTLDGIIGMNLLTEVNFVLRGGGLVGMPDPTLEFAFLAGGLLNADLDGDRDVDQADFGRLQVCFSGRDVPQEAAGCSTARLDGDCDVDADDLLLLLGCLSGPGVPGSPACVP